MEPLISVIVPVYNAEPFLNACVEGLLRQTYQNLEIILVDDGSTDRSGEICDAYAAQDSRVLVLHKENGGQAEARNLGIDRASGAFLAFADSDDEVAEDYIAYLYRLIDGDWADIAVCRYRSVRQTGLPFETQAEETAIRRYDAKAAVQDLCYQKHLTFAVYCMLVRSELFRDIRFPVGMIYEEMDVIPALFSRADRIVYGGGVKYHYLQRANSTVRAEFSPRKMDYVKNTRQMMEHVAERYPDLRAAAQSRFLWANLHVYVQMTDQNSEFYREVKGNIRRYRGGVLRDPNVRLENKALICLSFGGNRLIRAVYRWKNRLCVR